MTGTEAAAATRRTSSPVSGREPSSATMTSQGDTVCASTLVSETPRASFQL